MRKFVSMGLVMLLSVAGVPFGAAASAQQEMSQTATLSGTSYQADQPLAGARVQIRNLETGELVASTTSGQSGEFLFTGLPPGTYIVEVADVHGVLGMTAPFRLAAGVSHTITVAAVARGAAASSTRGGFSLFGLGPVATMAVLGAAGAAAVTAVVSTSPDASPSR